MSKLMGREECLAVFDADAEMAADWRREYSPPESLHPCRVDSRNARATIAALWAERDALRGSLVAIRDSTYRNAVTLRGMADRALASQGAGGVEG